MLNYMGVNIFWCGATTHLHADFCAQNSRNGVFLTLGKTRLLVALTARPCRSAADSILPRPEFRPAGPDAGKTRHGDLGAGGKIRLEKFRCTLPKALRIMPGIGAG
jgi:hypothetical protein